MGTNKIADGISACCSDQRSPVLSRRQRLEDNDAANVDALDMLTELRENILRLIASMRHAHDVCAGHQDLASAGLLDNFIDQAESVWGFFTKAAEPAKSGSRDLGDAQHPPGQSLGSDPIRIRRSRCFGN
jgi:Ferritin-like domain.